ncbi:NAD(+) diphosphatase [Veronia pacifica]|uniref:NAD(+) diphosphatase n=1 Tax=Veronia pacifica TaxID=1080227 RepID=A0A1C3EQQ1_9GAMM|nr:NAD(+) diphosphatase [Veronia pacifica]ODA35571.1 hypothetical protein A8L45_02800 [Veronia pacifica]
MVQTYAGMPLDRQSRERKKSQWLEEKFNDSRTLFIPVKEGKVLSRNSAAEDATYFVNKQLVNDLTIEQTVFLGESENQAYFAIDCWELSPSQEETVSALGEWHEVRQARHNKDSDTLAILAYAKALCYWHQENGYCGRCGHPSQSAEGGHTRRCTNSACNKPTFPRTDPAVIMLVEKRFDDGIVRCLLGRQAKWPTGRYSTLAGFVDPGETLEEAVIREVYEESSIHCVNPTYVASQPWPFPSSLMLGFIATATSIEIDTENDELEKAKWCSREELDLLEATGTVIMPPSDSISSFLINSWRQGDIGTQ